MKKALVLSGGAALGAFQAGFLCRDKVKYDLICGVSAGALNGAMIAQEKYDALWDIWNDFASDRNNVYTSKSITPDGKLKPFSLLWQIIKDWPMISIAKNLPLKNLINTYIVQKDIKTKLIIGTTSLNNFSYSAISSDSLDQENLTKLLLASSAFPGIFPPVKEIEGKWGQSYQQMADGGIGFGSSLSDAVNWIKKYDDSPDKWHIDIITTRKESGTFKDNPKNILQILWRAASIVLKNNSRRDLGLFLDRNEKEEYVKFSYRIISPQVELGGSWEFTEAALKNSWQHGYNLASELNF